VLPILAQHHTVRVFDLQPPALTGLAYVEGSVGDPRALAGAMEGIEALLYMAMGSHRPVGGDEWAALESRVTAYDVSVKGVHLALHAAHRAGITHAVYTSSMSVYHKAGAGRYMADEDLPPDASHYYGFTKRLGEEVCRNAVREWGMSINVLRLCLPQPEERWLAETRPGEPTIATTGEDTARALLAALDYRAGFQVFTISGDYEQKLMSLAKAKRLLGWEPLARPRT
jgi:nucleoside-diphosphate-sugar epimerase